MTKRHRSQHRRRVGHTSRREFLILALLLVASWAHADGDPRLAQGRDIAASFQQQLGSRLKSALSAGGPVEAIGVCRSDAPAIAARLSEEGGARVGRIALKVRNPANAPDADQRLVLQEFRRLLAAGVEAPPERLESRPDGRDRYMKAIATQPICLMCHGAMLSPQVAAALARHYPDDEATGFDVGELRGAFVVEWPSPSEDQR